MQAFVFPALFQEPSQPGTVEAVLVEGQSSCYYHPNNLAVLPCDGCGRFLCSLCHLELGDRDLCPSCLESGQRKGTLPRLDRRRVMWDSVALWLAALPILMWPFTLLTAPAAMFLAIRHWRAPLHAPVPRSRVRNVVAIAFSALQIAGWSVGIYSVFL